MDKVENTPAPGWEELREIDAQAMVEARLQVHYAAQLAAAVGAALLEARPDDSHPNLGWHQPRRALTGRIVPGQPRFAAALQLPSLRLALHAEDDTVVDETELAGASLHDASRWLTQAVAKLGAPIAPNALAMPLYDIPDHPVASGRPFSSVEGSHGEALEQLARWYANADRAIAALQSRTPQSSEVRCWPHHLDIATLATVETDAGGNGVKTIGVGLSPGDESYPEPYWYVSPWPYPDRVAAERLPLPQGSHWHTAGFTAAVFPARPLLRTSDATEQSMRVQQFLTDAFSASRKLLE